MEKVYADRAGFLPDGRPPAHALQYNLEGTASPNYGKPTSVEVVQTPDGGARKNEDISKNASLIPPTFGSPTSNVLNSGSYLTPDLAPNSRAATGGAIINRQHGGGSAALAGNHADAVGRKRLRRNAGDRHDCPSWLRLSG